jgi:hypothetical protein
VGVSAFPSSDDLIDARRVALVMGELAPFATRRMCRRAGRSRWRRAIWKGAARRNRGAHLQRIDARHEVNATATVLTSAP